MLACTALGSRLQAAFRLVVLLVATVVGLAAAGCTLTPTYDYLMLVQQWPVTDCTTSPLCNPTDEYFTIHGRGHSVVTVAPS